MNDLEKAKEISDIYMPDTGFNREDLYDAAMQMAQWKDEQFKKQKKLNWKEVKLIIELDGNIETDSFMGSVEYYQAIADKANVVLFGLQGKID